VPIFLKSWSPNLPEPSGPVQAYKGIALPLPLLVAFENNGSVDWWRKAPRLKFM